MSKTQTNEPEFQYQAQTKLWRTRREYAILTGFRFNEELEERLAKSLSVENAAAAAVEAEVDLTAFKKDADKRKRKTKGKTSPSSTNEQADGGEGGPSSANGDSDKRDLDIVKRDPKPKDDKSATKPSGQRRRQVSAVGSGSLER
jgi:hypothetical protein